MSIRLNGGRGAALLVAGLYSLARSVAYLPVTDTPSSLPAGLELISAVFVIEVWGVVWMITGLLCLVSGFTKKDYVAWGALTGMMTAWGVAYGLGWIMALLDGEPSREWLNMTSYLAPAIIIGILSARRASKTRPDRAT